jgi:pimeloyl-ACP methyl ester carboxylesterase
MNVFYHAPAEVTSETDVWFVIHGAGRNGAGYRDAWIEHVQDDNVLLLVPEFSRDDFPGSRSYNLGDVRDADGGFRSEEEWTFSVVERLFDHVRAKLGLEVTGYLIYGHSAGSQFVHRMILLRSGTRARAVYLANAGWYTLPNRAVEFPFGLGGTPVTDERLREVFQLPVVVLLGDQDTDPEHRQLSRTEGAMAQGPHRFARGRHFFETAREAAEALEVPFEWSMEVVEGVAHSNAGMARAAARRMRQQERSQAEE